MTPTSQPQPLVSVAMITYNHERWIARAIEGVLAQQTDFPFELIIGEDCSTDGTRAIVEAYRQKFPERIRLVTSDANVGAHENNRRTLNAARGRYTAFCEGDDYWHRPDKLARQIAYLESHPNCVLVHSNYDLLYEHSGKRQPNAGQISADWNDRGAYEELLMGRRYVLTVTAVARTELLTRVRAQHPECYDPRFQMGDMQMWLELARLGEVHGLSDSLATHNMLAESATHSTNPAKELRFACSLRDLVLHYVEKYPCSPTCAREARRWTTLFALEKAWKAGNATLATDLYREFTALGTRFSPHAWLLYRGSRTPFTRKLSQPAITAYGMLRGLVPTR